MAIETLTPNQPAPVMASVPPVPDHRPPNPAVTTLQRESTDAGGSWNRYFTIIGIIGLAVTLIVTGRYLYVSQQIKSFSTTIANLQTQYTTLQSTENTANDIKAISDALTTVYTSQLSYTGLLKKLEETTYNGARYTSVSLDDKGQVVLSGRVTSYLDFAKTVKSFKEKGTSAAVTTDVVINSVGQEMAEQPDGSRVRQLPFSLSFVLDSSLLLPAHTAPVTTTSTTPTTEDSALTSTTTGNEDSTVTTPTSTTNQSIPTQNEVTTLPEGTL